jgi:aryl-alcohol dehydrogenase-like predicted oxidoreductase
MKLALGTAQFGLKYGVNNISGRINHAEARAILFQASQYDFDTLDTAIAYGDSERILGGLGIDQWQVVTKLSAVPDAFVDIVSWVHDEIRKSMERLQVGQLHGVLLHRPSQLLQTNGDQLYEGLRCLKDQGLTRKIGVSVYEPKELDQLLNSYDLDLVQAPLNLMDRRLVESGWAKQLKDAKIELHTRSAFLQGLLLMPSHKRPKKFNRWADVWSVWDDWLLEVNLTPLEACLRYLNSVHEIDRIVVGVDTADHLRQIFEALQGSLESLPNFRDHLDARLINPAAWSDLEVE